jgi:hypothetical protein
LKIKPNASKDKAEYNLISALFICVRHQSVHSNYLSQKDTKVSSLKEMRYNPIKWYELSILIIEKRKPSIQENNIPYYMSLLSK